MNPESRSPESLKILSLDGGGAKGFYTIGILHEIEALIDDPIHESFDLIFGTSTGAIIAALLGLGRSIAEVRDLYREHVPRIMRANSRRGRSRQLSYLASAVFGESDFRDFKTGIGIVATRWDLERPMIFKGELSQAHGRRATFSPGFGCSVAEAVRASCSAYPFFDRPKLTTGEGDRVELVDGGYCANNPTLYAIADAVHGLGVKPSDLRVVSLGVGSYPEPRRWLLQRVIRSSMPVQLLQKTLDTNTASMDQLRSVLFSDVPTVRISDTFERPEMATDLLEHDLEKLNLLFQQGRESFARHEADLASLLGVSTRDS